MPDYLENILYWDDPDTDIAVMEEFERRQQEEDDYYRESSNYYYNDNDNYSY